MEFNDTLSAIWWYKTLIKMHFYVLINKLIEFDCETLDNILGISNEGPRVFEVKIIPTTVDFMYDEVIAQHPSQLDFALGVKIKS